MAPQNPVPWEADLHTKAKHALYEHYLSKWMPIMIRGFGANITYAEGFSGPGVYLDGSPGSPVIALRALLADSELRMFARRGAVRFVFVDHDRRCTDRLAEELAVAAAPVAVSDLPHFGIHATIKLGECEPNLTQALDEAGAWDRPMLVVLDTWGGAVSHDLVQRVAENGSSEVIITMQPQYFSRFAGVDDIVHGDKVFGGTAWRDVAAEESSAKERWLLQHYRDTVRSAGFDFVLDFELMDVRGQALYLVFGTTHPRGLQKMKEAMWEVDEVAGAGYRDPRDPLQETLEIRLEPHTAPLRRLIVQQLASLPGQTASLRDLRKFALYQTVYKESQVVPVIQEMVAARQLVTDGESLGRARSLLTKVSLPP